MKLTQNAFASVMGVSTKTVEAWERGANKPMGSASRMLAMFQKDIEIPQKYGIIEI